jgi:hypothetical protein
VAVDICPPRRGNRKGAVEKQNHFSAQRWWRTARISNLAQAQAAYDRFQETIGDYRRRRGRPVVELAEDEHLLPLPVPPFPSCLEVERSVSHSALVAFRGNLSGVGPGLVGATVKVRLCLGSDAIAIVSATGSLLAEHRLEPAGAGVIRRLPGQREALEAAVRSAFTTRPLCRRKENRPPGLEAVAAARKLLDMAPIRSGSPAVSLGPHRGQRLGLPPGLEQLFLGTSCPGGTWGWLSSMAPALSHNRDSDCSTRSALRPVSSLRTVLNVHAGWRGYRFAPCGFTDSRG